jgi:small-conductance mechanosensitive channel
MNVVQEVLRYHLFSITGSPVNVATVAISLLIALLSFWLARFAEKATIRVLQRNVAEEDGSIGASARLVYFGVLSIGIAIAVQTLGINLTALFTAGAVFAIAFGFAMQNITQNFVSGLILLFERTIKPGDILEVEGRMVKVTKLGMRATVTRTWDADNLIIPNSVLVASTVKNFTLTDKLHRIRTLVGVSYGSDMTLVRQVLERTAEAQPWREPTAKPVVLMKTFGTSSVDFDVSVWVDDPFGRSLSQSNLNEAIWFALKEAGVTIAYPQMDLHFDQAALDAVSARDE